ncbi:DNA oxidative demethylase ALKBH2 isoform X2 [Candoia aspera]|uniref:DNA oxidative demethylase ALKBH2 isoform X2 n=1 Tax=Candoia aspera TaxID=51853 RepID=UPI002FD80EE1
MESVLIPGLAAGKSRAPRDAAAAAAAGSAEQGGRTAAKRARREASPSPGAPWERIRAEGLSCDYVPLFGRAEADGLFRQLETDVEYFEGELTKLHIFGKWHDIPRKQVTYGDAGLTYTYSGVTFSPKPWIPVLNHIRERVHLVTGHTFNFVLINRDFIFRHGASRGKNPSRRIGPVKLQLDHGSLLVMNFPTNRYWYHSLPSRKKVLAPRINLTFRKIRSV